MRFKFLLSLLLCFSITFGLSLAQEHDHSDDSQDHSTHEQSEEHTDDSGDHNMTDDHSEHDDHAEHMDDGDSMVGMKSEAHNAFMIAEQQVLLDPLVLADGSFQLGVRLSNMSLGMPQLSVVSPSGETSSPFMRHGSSMDVMTFPVGRAEEGIYRVSVALGDEIFELPVGVYTAQSDSVNAYLVLAPNPSLSSRGQTQTFLYGFEGDEPIHKALSLQRSMAGMQHMTDEEQLSFEHTHFNDLYDDALGTQPMSNEMALNFAMAGTWDVNVSVMSDDGETLNFAVMVLDE